MNWTDKLKLKQWYSTYNRCRKHGMSEWEAADKAQERVDSMVWQ